MRKIKNQEHEMTEEGHASNGAVPAWNEEKASPVGKIHENAQTLPSSEYTMEDLIPASRGNGWIPSGTGALSIINSSKNGKRLTIGREVLDKLGNPNYVQIFFSENAVVVMAASGDEQGAFTLKPYGKKGIIYSAPLVQEITDYLDINFSNKVSHTCYDVSFELLDNEPIASIPIY